MVSSNLSCSSCSAGYQWRLSADKSSSHGSSSPTRHWRRISWYHLCLVTVVVASFCVLSPADAIGVFPTRSTVGTQKPLTIDASCSHQMFCSHASPTWQMQECVAQQCNQSCLYHGRVPPITQVQFLTPGGPYTFFGSTFRLDRYYIINRGYLQIRAALAPAFNSVPGFSFQHTVQRFFYDAENTLFEKISSATGRPVFRFRFTGLDSDQFLTLYADYTLNGNINKTLTMSNVPNFRPFASMNTPGNISVSVVNRTVLVYFNGQLLRAGLLDGPIVDQSGPINFGSLSSGYWLDRNVYFTGAGLSERDAMIYSGLVPPTYLPASGCHCPPSHPEVDPSSTSMCHNQFISANGRVPRFAGPTYETTNANDGNLQTAAVTRPDVDVVQLTVDLQGIFEVFGASIQFWNPRPNATTLSLSLDGVNFRTLQYFADYCSVSFPAISSLPRSLSSDVNCKSDALPSRQAWEFFLDQENSSLPLPDFGAYNNEIVPFATARYVRFQLVEQGVSSSSSILDRYYGITEMSVQGRCACSGHADACTLSSATNVYTCNCQYNTEGDQCERCQALFNDKPWQAGNSTSLNACKQCTCNGHATSCAYNRSADTHPNSRLLGGGGVCACRDNTAGRNCDQCMRRFYRDPSKALSSPDVCLACNCMAAGVVDDGECVQTGLETGQCNCKQHVTGLRCDRCETYAFLNTTAGDCQDCQCNGVGSVNESCSASGQCFCMLGFQGLKCDECAASLELPMCNTCLGGFYNSSSGASGAACAPCACTALASLDNVCDKTSGQCNCRDGFSGRDCSMCDPLAAVMGSQCNVCIAGYHSYNASGNSSCAACSCHAPGSSSGICSAVTGQCPCMDGFTGRDCNVCHPGLGTTGQRCSTCQDGFHSFNGSHCEPCLCSTAGASSITCNDNGTCLCKANTMGEKCDQCSADTISLTAANPSGCTTVPAPSVTALDSTRLLVAWSSPQFGTGIQYTVFRDQGQAAPRTEALRSTAGDITISGLAAYTNYTFYIRACASVSCATSPMTTQRTRAGAPSGQAAPQVLARNGSTVIGWAAPTTTGGGPLVYTLRAINADFTYPRERLVPGAQFEGLGYLSILPTTLMGMDVQIALTFQTLSANAVLLFAADQFVAGKTALQIVNGEMQFLYDFGDGAVTVVSPSTSLNVSDGRKHTVLASRIGQMARLSVDVNINGTAQTNAAASGTMPLPTQVYLGGVPAQVASILPSTSPFSRGAFTGCQRDLSLQGRYVDMDAVAVTRERVLSTVFGCPEQVSRAIHFLGTQEGYVVDNENPLLVTGGTTITIRLSFRTTTDSGLLLYSGTPTSNFQVMDFFAVQIRTQQVWFIFDNGGSITRVKTSLAVSSINVCDGQWHTVVVTKNGRVGTITVDGQQFSETSTGLSSSVDVTTPVYLGGYPSTVPAPSAISSTRYFTGCIQAVSINSVAFTPDMAVFARLSGCPVSQPTQTCRSIVTSFTSDVPGSLYMGASRQVSFGTTGPIRPASEFSMQLQTRSESGVTSSPWVIIRATDGAPTGFIAPSARYTSGSVAVVTWSPPAVENGLLLGYGLVVFRVATYIASSVLPSTPSGIFNVSSETLSYQLTNLIPSHFYAVRVESFTGGGGVATGLTNFTTLEAAPSNVSSPQGNASRRVIQYAWQRPGEPNGIITNYSLYINNTRVFTTANINTLSYSHLGLQPVTAYEAALEACTAAGCSRSLSSTAWTLEDVPEGVMAPQLTALSEISLLATWSVPAQPNGVITSYSVFVNGSLETTINGSSPRRLVIGNLLPATVYSVNLRAATRVGSADSVPSSLATLEHVPAGIAAPNVVSVLANTVSLSWTAPLTPNGVIVEYDIELGDSRLFLNLSASTRSVVIPSLTPFTSYTFAVVACTAQGCSTGNETSAQTLEAVPQGVQTPSLRVVSSSSIEITWSPPTAANGMVMYALHLFGGWLVNGAVVFQSRLISSDATSPLLVNNLLAYQDYHSVVEARTSVGAANSTQSSIVRTSEAVPMNVSRLSVAEVFATQLNLTWQPPLLPNGIITGYTLTVSNPNSATAPTNVAVAGDTLSSLVTNLRPFTTYQIQLTASTSQGSASSMPISQRTAESIPSGVPVPTVVNATSSGFDLSWMAPSSPNGVIIRYSLVFTGPTGRQTLNYGASLRRAVVTDGSSISLSPATTYGLHIDACTNAGCGSSREISIKTLEAAPEGVQPPTVTLTNSTFIEFTWMIPTQPNGVITSYRVVVRLASSSTQVVSITFNGSVSERRGTVSTGLAPSMQYTLQLFASTEAGTGMSTLVTASTADGTPTGVAAPQLTVLSSTSINVAWTAPSQPNGAIQNYTITRGGTQIFMSGVPGSFADNGLMPFTTYMYQLEVCTTFACGKSGASQETTAEDAPAGIAAPQVMSINSSAIRVTWTAPTVANGVIRNYTISRDGNEVFMASAASSFIDTGLTPFTTYTYEIEVCTTAACSSSGASQEMTGEAAPTGFTAPSAVAVNATAIAITWVGPNTTNGVIQSYQLTRFLASGCCSDPNVLLCQQASVSTTCLTSQSVVVTSTLSLSHVDSSIAFQPFTAYAYQLSARTNGGTGASPYALVVTPEARPAGVRSAVVTSRTARSLLVEWLTPTTPNGNIQRYAVYRNGSLLRNFSSVGRFNDTGLLPATSYSYTIIVCTSAGCSSSAPESARTLESVPEAVLAPSALTALSATSVRVTWTAPAQPNGAIVSYDILVNGSTLASTNNLVFSAVIGSLQPFTTYVVFVSACTAIGCTNGSDASVTTLEAVPIGLQPPTLMVLTSTSVDVSWMPPTMPRGVVLGYNVYRNDSRIANLSSDMFMYTDTGLLPHTVYSYAVSVRNSAGSVMSTATSARTGQDTPQGVPAPTVVAINSTAFRVTLAEPTQPNGIVLNYSVIVDSNLVVPLGLMLVTSLSGYLPNSMHQFRSEVCTIRGCAISTVSVATTAEALAGGVMAPNISALNSSAIGIFWSPPPRPNGAILAYIVQRVSPDNITLYRQAASASNFLIIDNGLAPYTTYAYRIGVVNGAGTSFGPVSFDQTDESVPEMLQPIVVDGKALDGTSLNLTWAAPLMPNGIITSYVILLDGVFEYQGLTRYFILLRLQPATTYGLVLRVCTSVGCSDGKPQSIQTAEVAPIVQAVPRTQALGSTFIRVTWSPPAQPNGLILSYSVRRKLSAAADASAVQVFSANVANITVLEYDDRTGLTPFTEYSYSVTSMNSAGQVSSAFGPAVRTLSAPPQGVSVISVVTISHALLRLSWVVPTTPNGIIAGYNVYRNGVLVTPVILSASTFGYIDSTGLTPFTTYTYQLEACTVSANCSFGPSAVGTTAESQPSMVDTPALVATSASSVFANWSAPMEPNGMILGYRLFTAVCLMQTTTVAYSGLDMDVTVSGLIAFTCYSVHLEACTAAGCSNSTAATIQTLEAPPQGLLAPTATAVGVDSVNVIIMAPSVPNGVIVSYEIERNGTSLTFVNDSASFFPASFRDGSLVTNTLYAYTVIVSTGGGDTRSPPAYVRTFPPPPESLSEPMVAAINATSLLVSWSPPGVVYTPITMYAVFLDGAEVITNNGTSLSTQLDGLFPFTSYTVHITACSGPYCVTSNATTSRTLEAPPAVLAAPALVEQSLREILVRWAQPSRPNGILTMFIVERRRFINSQVVAESTVVVVTVLSNTTSYVDRSVLSFSTYEYRIAALNSAGSVRSPWQRIQTRQGAPENVRPPTVVERQLTTIVLLLAPPGRANGVLTRYELLINGIVEMTNYTAGVTSHTVDLLIPGTEYSVFSQVCTVAGCTNSSADLSFITQEAAPLGLGTPEAVNITSSSFSVVWMPPIMPNGEIDSYVISIQSVCPQPGMLPGTPCEVGQKRTVTEAGNATYTDILDLLAFTSYSLNIEARSGGGTVVSNSTVVQTSEAAPALKAGGFVNITTAGVELTVNWANAFVYNSDRFVQYTVTENEEPLSNGVIRDFSTTFLGLNERTPGTTYTYTVELTTALGSITSLPVSVTISEGTEEVTSKKFYEEVAFIIGMCFVGLIIILFLICLATRPTSSKLRHSDLTDGSSPRAYSPNRSSRPTTPNRRRRAKPNASNNGDFWTTDAVALAPPSEQSQGVVLLNKQPRDFPEQEWDTGFVNLDSKNGSLRGSAHSVGNVSDSQALISSGAYSKEALAKSNTFREYEGSTLKDTHL